MPNPERGSHIHDEAGRIEDANIAHEMAKTENPWHKTRPRTLWEKLTWDKQIELINERLRKNNIKAGERKAVEVGKLYERAFRTQDKIIVALRDAAAKKSPDISVWTLDYTNTASLQTDRLQVQVDMKDPDHPNTPGMERPIVQVYIKVLDKGKEISVHHGAYGKDTTYGLDQADQAIADAIGAIEERPDQTKQAA